MKKIWCKNCFFWQPFPDNEKEGKNDGDCHLRGPSPFFDVNYPNTKYPDIITLWPVTASEDWCGEAISKFDESLTIQLQKSDFSARIWNTFTYKKIETIGNLVSLSEKEIRHFGRIGNTSMREIKRFLKDRGLELRKE